MKLTNNLVPYIKKERFDYVATEFLKKYCPEALLSPIQVPIESIARDKMNLLVEHVSITEDLSIYGQIFFTDGIAEIYVKETDEFVRREVKKGTVFIDEDVLFLRNKGCERNTLAHECLHWYRHRLYFELQNLFDSKMAVACKCPIEVKSEDFKKKWTEEDWMEWQANGIAPKILMPREMFIKKANEYLSFKPTTKEEELSNLIYCENAVAELAEFFNVSKQSASIRLKELGYCAVI